MKGKQKGGCRKGRAGHSLCELGRLAGVENKDPCCSPHGPLAFLQSYLDSTSKYSGDFLHGRAVLQSHCGPDMSRNQCRGEGTVLVTGSIRPGLSEFHCYCLQSKNVTWRTQDTDFGIGFREMSFLDYLI